jgi:NitT/TauT family transport system substrate-binding protein
VNFLRALIKAEDVFLSSPSSVYSRVASAVGMNATVLQNVWQYHNFNGTAGLPSDLLSVLVAEDQWVAQQDNRQAMSQSTLEGLIDSSVLADALKPAS